MFMIGQTTNRIQEEFRKFRHKFSNDDDLFVKVQDSFRTLHTI